MLPSLLKAGRYFFKTIPLIAEWAFLQQLNEKTVVDCMFENTDFFRSLIGLQENLSVLERNGFNVECVKSGIYKILNYYANVRNYSVCHRDFTPWNMFYENDILFVFDFEYAQYTYPKYKIIKQHTDQKTYLSKG